MGVSARHRGEYGPAIGHSPPPAERLEFDPCIDATQARARETIRHRAASSGDPANAALLESLAARRKFAERLLVKCAGKERLLPVAEVDWFEAAGNYVKIHTGGERLLLRETMANLETRLDPEQFARIHRSTIVNLRKVKELEPWFHGDYVVRVVDGHKRTLSGSYRAKLLEKLGDGG